MSPRVLDRLTVRVGRLAKLARAIGLTAVLAALNPTA